MTIRVGSSSRDATLFTGLLTSLTLALQVFGQSVTRVVDTFDPVGIGGNSYAAGQITNVWINWFGDAFRSVGWDATQDAGGNSASGSIRITAVFDGAGSIPDQFEVFNGFNGIQPPLNGSQYTNFQCDVRFDASSPTVLLGGTPYFGRLEFGTQTGGYGQDYFGGIDIPASNTNWVHVSIPINPSADPNLTNIADVLIHIYGPYYGSPGLRGTTTFWIDNIQFAGIAPTPNNCVVDWHDLHQRIDGFGASSAWEANWTTAQADMFFSTNTGIGLSLLRTRIAPDGTTLETPIMQLARDRGARIWSTPWSPPAAFKDSGTVNGGNFVSTNNQAYANQLADYVVNMKTNYQVDLYAISVQNEPDYNTTTYESCIWNAQQIHDFVPYLYDALSNRGVASTKILIAESGGWNFSLTANAMNDLVTSNLVGILAAHDYDGGISQVNSSGKALWETEVSTFDAFDPSIENGLSWAVQIHSFLTYAGVNAWHYWWLIPYATDNESLTDPNGNPAKRMYVLGNFSRFVRPNFYRIGVYNNASTYVSAYKDPDSGAFAIVAVNTNPSDLAQTFNLSGFTTANVTPWVTSASLSLVGQPAISVTNATFVYTLPALSVVTFVGQRVPDSPSLSIRLAGTQATVTMNGPAGNYTLSTSTNLSNWQSVLTTNAPALPATWIDPVPATASRFYRVQLGP